HNIRKLYTALGTSMVRGAAMHNIAEVEDAVILVRDDGTIEYAGPKQGLGLGVWGRAEDQQPYPRPQTPDPIDCRGLVAMPGFVDSHTHVVFAGERSLEFAMRAEGRSYQEIAAMGGGIRSSVESVQK